MSGAARIVVFCKEPAPGRVKTRLAAHLGAERAAALAWVMLEDTLAGLGEAARELGAEPWLLYDPASPRAGPPGAGRPGAGLRALAAEHGWRLAPQAGGGLGERLAAGLAEGEVARLALGGDAPDLPRAHLRDALARLAPGCALFDPAPDGGFVLLGLGQGVDGACLADPTIAWSSSTALAGCAGALEAAGARLLPALPGWRDVDELADLEALAARLGRDPTAAPRTAVWLEGQRAALGLPPASDCCPP
ncbi:MAG: DUF2064 domain-containing protein [Planctomycetota bacterium]